MNSCNKLKMLEKIETSFMLDWYQYTLFILAVLFRMMIFMIIFSDMSLKLITFKYVLFDTFSMSWMLNIMIYKQYKAEKSMMKIIEKA